MRMRLEETTVHGWPGYALVGARIRLGVVPCPGGRIASICHDGEELLFVQRSHQGERVDLSGELRALKAELGFRVWGGNKTWVAPQSEWQDGIPPLDLDAGDYDARAEEDAITLVSPVCRETGLEITRRVHLADDDTILVEHSLANPGAETITRGLWDVTQWLRPFDVYFEGRPRAYPEEGTTEEIMRAHVHDANGWTRVEARNAAQFKVGARVSRGEVIALRPGAGQTLIVRTTFENEPNAAYAHDASVEVFNSGDHPYLEIEIHAPLAAIPPGGRVSFSERIQVERREGDLDIGDL